MLTPGLQDKLNILAPVLIRVQEKQNPLYVLFQLNHYLAEEQILMSDKYSRIFCVPEREQERKWN